jgi:hypothetical protein
MEKMQSELDKAKAEFDRLSKILDEKEKLVRDHYDAFSSDPDYIHNEEGIRLNLDRDAVYHQVFEAREKLWKLQEKK